MTEIPKSPYNTVYMYNILQIEWAKDVCSRLKKVVDLCEDPCKKTTQEKKAEILKEKEKKWLIKNVVKVTR